MGTRRAGLLGTVEGNGDDLVDLDLGLELSSPRRHRVKSSSGTLGREGLDEIVFVGDDAASLSDIILGTVDDVVGVPSGNVTMTDLSAWAGASG